MSYYLGLDCGGTLIKAGIYDETGHEYAVARSALDTISRQPGWQERNLANLWHHAAAVIHKAIASSGLPACAISGVGISAQGKGVYLLDRQGQVLRDGILSSDQRALDIVRTWQQDGIPEQLYPHTLQTLWTGHPVSLLRWLKLNEPGTWAQIGHVLMAHDYLRFCLTGQIACEETNISESNLFNMQTGRYDPALAALLGIEEIMDRLPPVIGATDIAGTVTAQAAALTGLAVGTPVVGGLFDVVSTALCAGIVDETRLNAVMGTWSVTSGITRQIKTHPTQRFVHGRHAVPGQYIVHAASPTSAANLEWVSRNMGATSAAPDHASINAAIAALPKAHSSVQFLPFLFGSNAGLGMKSGFYGLQAAHEPAHLLQAVYEGVVFSHYSHLLQMRECFSTVEALRVTGGPARSEVWMQMLSDMSGLPVEIPAVEETGCLGAALATAVGLGVHADFQSAVLATATPLTVIHADPTARDAYQHKYQRYQRLIECLRQFEEVPAQALPPFLPGAPA
ncbi:L-xylulokinase [Silvimonas terrae]|uniref:L-xylulokinase n=1 Tax=Silvimonas terrae TaxID=300266 RepID=A0A840RM35_9NEIS|nr:FGGY-family carbohydrate kinase [Silvimonas terrae]MBB5193560.1 L-xylulokinase [Silvimonas terrae]